MGSLHETAYPRLRSSVTPKELRQYYTPNDDELKLISTIKKSVLRLGLMLNLKLFQRLGYFVPLASAPPVLIEHLSKVLDLKRPLTRRQLKDYDGSEVHDHGSNKPYEAI